MKLKNSVEPLKKAFEDYAESLAQWGNKDSLRNYLNSLRRLDTCTDYYKTVRHYIWFHAVPSYAKQAEIFGDVSAGSVGDNHIETLLKRAFPDKFIDRLRG